MASSNSNEAQQDQSVPVVQQPKLKKASRKENRSSEENSWCHSVIFCGKRRHKRTVSELAEISKSVEAQNSECAKNIEELNNYLAVFRDHLMHVAKPQDCPEIRDRIKETRRKCLELCISTSDILMPQVRSDVADGIPVDNQQLVNLVCCTQLFHRELRKCYSLVVSNPMDMTTYYEKKPRTSGVSVLDKLILFKMGPRDYHKEELQSIVRDTEKTTNVLHEMKEFMPCESNDKMLIDENVQRWNKRTKKGSYKFAEGWICYCGSNLS
ncbi:hypothetical protein X975_26155, partial [Stegodyphus mimosarum]